MPQTLRSEIDTVISTFDFAKVQKVMEFLNWTWRGEKLPPTIDELKSTAYHLLDKAVTLFEEKGRTATGMVCATGGFQAEVHVFEKGTTQLDLLFYVDQSTSAVL